MVIIRSYDGVGCWNNDMGGACAVEIDSLNVITPSMGVVEYSDRLEVNHMK